MIDRGRRRRRAKQLMDGLTVTCVTLALAVGTGQLVKEGLQEFLFRPPGVGASPSEAETANASAAPTLPPIVQVIPPAPPPLLRPVERRARRGVVLGTPERHRHLPRMSIEPAPIAFEMDGRMHNRRYCQSRSIAVYCALLRT